MPVILEPEQFGRWLSARLLPKFGSRGQRSAATMGGFDVGEYSPLLHWARDKPWVPRSAAEL
jgi:hypothetical protein